MKLNCIKKIKELLKINLYDKKAISKISTMPRRRGILPILDKYILHDFLIKFSILLLVFDFGFIMGEVFDSFGDFMEAEASVGVTTAYFFLKLPENIKFILPICMLLSCIWTMASLGKYQEITAMRASGISLIRCGCPILLIGLLVTFINISLNEYLIPTAKITAETIKKQADANFKAKKTPNAKIVDVSTKKQLAFRSSNGRRTWFFQVFDRKALHENVILKYYRPDGTLEYDINAKHARYVADHGWYFADVTKTEYNNTGLLPYESKTFPVLTFDKSAITETPDDIFNAIQEEEDLPSWIILDILLKSENMSKKMKNVYWTLFFYRLALPWSCFLAALIGIPLATKGERSGIMLAIISAIGVVIGFMIVANIGLIMGKQGTLPPIIAGLAPTICFMIYGYYKVKNSQC